MREVFNTLAKMPRVLRALKATFDAAKTGVDKRYAGHALITFVDRADKFDRAIAGLSPEVRNLLIKNLSVSSADNKTGVIRSTPDIFKILDKGFERTKAEIKGRGDPEEATILFNAAYRLGLLRDWYYQDFELMPVFDAYGIAPELTRPISMKKVELAP